MRFDDIVVQIGEFGPYQRRIYFLVALISIPVAFNQVGQVWLAGTPDHWCKSPELESVNCDEFNLSQSECELEKRAVSIPKEGSGYSECERYNLTGVIFYPGLNISKDTDTLECDESWVYDDSVFEATVVTDFDLVCNKKNLPDLSSSIFFAGMLIGAVLYGWIADTFGRFPAFFICIFMELVVGISVMFSPNFTTFTVLRFILGTSNSGLLILGTVIGTEFLGPSRRVIGVMGMQMGFAIGYVTLALVAFLITKWRIIQFIACAPVVFFFLLIPIVPESPRWLMSQGKYDKAEQIIRKAAEINDAKVPEPLFDEAQIKEEQRMLREDHRPSVFDLFKTPNLRKNTLNLMYIWFVNSVVYYGLSLNTSDLGGNQNLSFFISGVVEIPAVIYATIAVEWFGRRLNLAGTEIMAGITVFATIIIPLGTWRTTVAMIGKCCAKASFCVVYIHSVEIFPTPVRSVGMGISAMATRFGGIVSPLIMILGDYYEPLPLIIIGTFAVSAGFLALLLPETKGQNLPESIEESELLGKKIKDSKTINLPEGNGHTSSYEGSDNPAFNDAKV